VWFLEIKEAILNTNIPNNGLGNLKVGKVMCNNLSSGPSKLCSGDGGTELRFFP
jgi:hypothetical protein